MEITAIVLWIVALMFILITVKNMIKRAVKNKRCTQSATGEIIDVKVKVKTRDGIRSREYIPTVLYSVNGIEYKKIFAKAYNVNTYTVGQAVEIKYNPNKPDEINKMGQSNKADIIILCIGILIGIIGAVLLAAN